MSYSRKCFQCGAPMEAGQQICPRCCTDQKRAGAAREPARPSPVATTRASSFSMASLAVTPRVKEPCAVCNPGLNFQSSFQWDGPRAKIAGSIISVLKYQGSYNPGGLGHFWQSHREHLCPSCKVKLDGINSTKQKALALLEEAVRLDPNNDAARRNLAALKSML